MALDNDSTIIRISYSLTERVVCKEISIVDILPELSTHSADMSLDFFLEAGMHGPIETELVKPEINQYLDDYSGVYTIASILHVQFRYNCHHSPRTYATARGPPPNNNYVAMYTPVQFEGGPPHFTLGLLRQLYLLEWAGLYKFLYAAYCDLANISDGDRQLLLSGVGMAKIQIHMTYQTAIRVSKNNRLLVWLAAWLLAFKAVTKDRQYGSLLCQLCIRGDDKEVITVSTTSDSSVNISARLSPEILSTSTMDGSPAFKVAIGHREELLAWAYRELMDEDEVYRIMSSGSDLNNERATIDTYSLVSTKASSLETKPEELGNESKGAAPEEEITDRVEADVDTDS